MSGGEMSVDSDIRRARSLPAEIYRDPYYFFLQRDRLFPRSWLFLTDEKRLKAPGHLLPWTLLPEYLDEPLLLTRDLENTLHCLSNVCTHRGNILTAEPTQGQILTCRYHGRRFSLDGTFRFMPEFEGVCGFPDTGDDLAKIPLAQWEQFLFAGLDPAYSFDDAIAPLRNRLKGISLREFIFDPSTSRDYEVQANWALYCDNYLEGFHIPYIHPGLAGTLDTASYKTEIDDYSVLQIGLAAPGEPCFELPASHPDFEKKIAAYYCWIFPTTMFNLYPWGLSINHVQPLAPDRTRVSFLSYVGDPSKRRSGAGAGLDTVEREDEAIVESVQKGVRSRFYKGGRFSPTQETGVHHFHRLLAQFMK